MATGNFSTENASPDQSPFVEDFPVLVPIPRHRGRIFPRPKPIGEWGSPSRALGHCSSVEQSSGSPRSKDSGEAMREGPRGAGGKAESTETRREGWWAAPLATAR
jgi:hypothetical protein